MLTLKAALEEASAAIGRVDAHVLVAHLLGVDRAYLVANPMRVLTETEDARIDAWVARRAIGHPVAYLTGRREFYSRDFAVGPDVLIPRPETETLVEAVLAKFSLPLGGGPGRGSLSSPALSPGGGPGKASVLDLGTGSGAIAVTLACERRDLRVVATDASAGALAVARENAAAHGCAGRIDFREGEWYGPVEGERFDVIVSNPPYIAAADPHLGEGDLRYEPPGALTDGSADGLGSIRAIVAGARAHLAPGGWLLFEHGYDQAQAARALLQAAGFRDLVMVQDLAGIPRVAGGKIE